MYIGIIGMGFVGSAVYANISSTVNILTYDKYKENHNTTHKNMVDLCDIIFVCVGTPSNEDGSIDISAVQEVLEEYNDYKGILVLKSTIPYEYINDADNLVYNPEFLNQISSIDDFKNQKYSVLGGDITNTKKVESFYKEYFNLTYQDDIKYEHCSIEEASNFKYFRNIKCAYNLMFWEYVQDITNNSRKYSRMMKNIPVSDMDIVGMDGFRGFGGACLPKDVSAFNETNRHLLTENLLQLNKRYNNEN